MPRAAVVGDRGFRAAAGLGAFTAGWFDLGHLAWTSGAYAGSRAEIARHTIEAGAARIELFEAPVWAIGTGDAFNIRAGFPAFPARADVWQDNANWQLGHWLTGRLGSTGLAELVRDLCRRGGLPEGLVDASRLIGVVPGYTVSGLESARVDRAAGTFLRLRRR